MFFLKYTEIYAFRGNPLQDHSVEQTYHPTQPFKQVKYKTNLKYISVNIIKINVVNFYTLYM